MATVADSGYPNLVNVTKRMKPDGSVETMLADTLSQELPMLDDIPMVEGNLPTGHRISAVNALPSPTWRKLNQGLDPTKGETLQYDETCGILEAHSKIDCALAELNGNEAAYRMSEDKLFIEGISQTYASSLFYDSVAVNSERIHGLAARYPATTGYTASKYTQIVGTPSATACQSIWFVTWDPERVFGIHPKASVGGLQYEDLGKKLVRDANSKDFLAYVSRYVWKTGLAVKDYRYVVRLQWDTADATNGVSTSKALYTAMEKALGTLWKVTDRTRIYWSRTSRNMVAQQLATADARFLTWETNQGTGIGTGMITERFLGIPTRITDSLVAETAIS